MLHRREIEVRSDYSDQIIVNADISSSRSTGLAGTFHPGLLGVYILDQDDFGRNVSGHHRHVFRHVETNDNWLYYWDWGPNSGTNWMVDARYTK